MTVIEVLIASVVLAAGLLSVLVLFPQSLDSARKSGRMLVIQQIAAEKLDYLRSLDYDASELAIGVHPAQQLDSGGGAYYPVAGFPEEYSVRWTVQAGPTDGSGTPELEIKTVVVEATYLVRYTLAGTPILEDRSLEIQVQTYLTRAP